MALHTVRARAHYKKCDRKTIVIVKKARIENLKISEKLFEKIK